MGWQVTTMSFSIYRESHEPLTSLFERKHMNNQKQDFSEESIISFGDFAWSESVNDIHHSHPQHDLCLLLKQYSIKTRQVNSHPDARTLQEKKKQGAIDESKEDEGGRTEWVLSDMTRSPESNTEKRETDRNKEKDIERERRKKTERVQEKVEEHRSHFS